MKKVYGILIGLVLAAIAGLGALYFLSGPATSTVSVPAETASVSARNSRGTTATAVDTEGLDPAETVEAALDALRTGDGDVFNDLITYRQSSSGDLFRNNLFFGDDVSRDDLVELFGELEFEITDVETDGEDAYVGVVVTSYDLTGLYEEFDEEDRFEQSIGEFVGGIVGKFTTDEATLHLTLMNGQWKIEADGDFVKVITGGTVSTWF